jgi:hypothetical protein
MQMQQPLTSGSDHHCMMHKLTPVQSNMGNQLPLSHKPPAPSLPKPTSFSTTQAQTCNTIFIYEDYIGTLEAFSIWHTHGVPSWKMSRHYTCQFEAFRSGI